MKKLVIIDFMYLMYRHFSYIKNKEKQQDNKPTLTNPNTGEESARLYFTIKDIETILQNHTDADVVVCADRPSLRKQLEIEETTTYKANRAGHLDELDIKAIDNTLNLLKQAGISTVYKDGFEADDLIYSIVYTYEENYDQIIIYTPDSDLAILIDDTVSLMRYKAVYSRYGLSGKSKHANLLAAHAQITKSNYQDYFSVEFSNSATVEIDYNAIMLYKVTVGDKSDNIKGIKGFGNAAYMRLRNSLIKDGHLFALKNCNCGFNTRTFLETICRHYLTPAQIEQALTCLEYVKPYYTAIDPSVLRQPENLDYRKQVYLTTWGIAKI